MRTKSPTDPHAASLAKNFFVLVTDASSNPKRILASRSLQTRGRHWNPLLPNCYPDRRRQSWTGANSELSRNELVGSIRGGCPRSAALRTSEGEAQ